MDARKTLAEHIGNLVIANIEQGALIAELQRKVAELGQRLHDGSDGPERTGAVSPPDRFAGT